MLFFSCWGSEMFDYFKVFFWCIILLAPDRLDSNFKVVRSQDFFFTQKDQLKNHSTWKMFCDVLGVFFFLCVFFFHTVPGSSQLVSCVILSGTFCLDTSTVQTATSRWTRQPFGWGGDVQKFKTCRVFCWSCCCCCCCCFPLGGQIGCWTDYSLYKKWSFRELRNPEPDMHMICWGIEICWTWTTCLHLDLIPKPQSNCWFKCACTLGKRKPYDWIGLMVSVHNDLTSGFGPRMRMMVMMMTMTTSTSNLIPTGNLGTFFVKNLRSAQVNGPAFHPKWAR